VIHDGLKENLNRYISEWDLKPSDYLFNIKGRQYSKMALQKAFKKCCELSGLSSRFSIHSTRHSYASYVYGKTHDLRMLQGLLGHSNIQTTRVYANLNQEDIKETLNGVFKSQAEGVRS